MEWLKQNPNAHLTAKERDRASFPLRWLAERGKLEGRVLDYGCGYGADVRYLERKGFEVTGYDLTMPLKCPPAHSTPSFVAMY